MERDEGFNWPKVFAVVFMPNAKTMEIVHEGQ